MKKIVVYVRIGSKYKVINLNDLKKGHQIFNKIYKKGNFDYLELGIDKIDIDGTYPIIRSIKNNF